MDDTDRKQMLAFFDELQQEPSAELKQAMAVLVIASGERLEKKLAEQRAEIQGDSNSVPKSTLP